MQHYIKFCFKNTKERTTEWKNEYFESSKNFTRIVTHNIYYAQFLGAISIFKDFFFFVVCLTLAVTLLRGIYLCTWSCNKDLNFDEIWSKNWKVNQKFLCQNCLYFFDSFTGNFLPIDIDFHLITWLHEVCKLEMGISFNLEW